MNAITVGRKLFTWRYTAVNDTTGTTLVIPDGIPDVMEIHIHFENGSGTLEGNTHDDSYPFNPGIEDIILPLVAAPGETIGTLRAVSGTVDVSVRAYSRVSGG